MLNENLASDLEIIKSQSWVQDGYCVTDSSPEFWEHPYDLVINDKTLRLCSTHLESLVAEPPRRPGQLAAAAGFMREEYASILGGDLNAIQPFDKSLHSENGLKDAYIENGGIEDAESGMTWGQMVSKVESQQIGLSRMDKLLFCGSLVLENFQTFGMDVQLKDPNVAEMLMQQDDLHRPWVTDHLGARGDFRLLSQERYRTKKEAQL
ncbi:hypothetical protein LTR51_005322 [Lithohypha guttulata]|nr:hypothetical protein LTR51_005322 [Lithohypha guttulata]